MKVLTFFLLMAPIIGIAQSRVSLEIFEPLYGKEWSGTLTYLNYDSDEEVSLPVRMNITPAGETSATMIFTFPDEPSANSTEKIEITDDGTRINGQKVESVQPIGEGNTELITSENGMDNGKEALITYTYVFGPRIYSSEKFVKYLDADRAFLRNMVSLRPADQ